MAPSAGPAAKSYSRPLGKGVKPESLNRGPVLLLPVERIDTGDFESRESRKENNAVYQSSIPNQPTASPDPKNYESDEHVNIVNDDDEDDDDNVSEKVSTGIGFDVHLPHQADTDDVIADVDVSDDEEHKVGRNAAEAPRAQVNAEGKEEQTSSSSSSSGSVAGVAVGAVVSDYNQADLLNGNSCSN
ncbi:uncharacterized protein LOC111305783 [Durio zibethinus]|uniref:Uncharacterized protein LOC111305783 n=1 Tax=Durio zibethinus TaxID=66656 RepID=A0A6P6A3G5_DURZI|nr:uncharacterized protein LOC111305783 [Durio zibethinus]XP_022759312.1 uncharacterized protein LOC111305783 [Durio zibethinus]